MLKSGGSTHRSECIGERVAPISASRDVDQSADKETDEAKRATGNEEAPNHAACGLSVQPIAGRNKLVQRKQGS